MVTKTRATDRKRATDLECYLPAGTAPPIEASQLERLLGRLFNYSVAPPK